MSENTGWKASGYNRESKKKWPRATMEGEMRDQENVVWEE